MSVVHLTQDQCDRPMESMGILFNGPLHMHGQHVGQLAGGKEGGCMQCPVLQPPHDSSGQRSRNNLALS